MAKSKKGGKILGIPTKLLLGIGVVGVGYYIYTKVKPGAMQVASTTPVVIHSAPPPPSGTAGW